MASAFRQFWNSSTGPKTTHFWGPIANWSFVIAGLADLRSPAENLSIPMTSALCVYSGLFMRFAYMVQPRNWLLFACHASNESVQMYHLVRAIKAQKFPSPASSASSSLSSEQPTLAVPAIASTDAQKTSGSR